MEAETMSGNGQSERVECKDVLATFRRKTGFVGRLLGRGKESQPMPVRNIGRDGLCFLSKDRPAAKAVLCMTVDFGAHRPTIHIEGKVAGIDPGEGRYPHKIEIAFTHLSSRGWEVLARCEQICKRREEGETSWRLHHTTRHESRPGGSLEGPGRGNDDARFA